MKYIVKTITKNNEIYYLVNGWSKANTFFNRRLKENNYFNSVRSAKCSITKLLNISKLHRFGYENDTFEIIPIYPLKKGELKNED